MLDIIAAFALAAALLTGAAQSGETTTSADGDLPIIVQSGGAPTAEGDRPIHHSGRAVI